MAIVKYGKPEIFDTSQGSQLGFMESSQHRLLQHAPAAVEPSSLNPGRGVLRQRCLSLGPKQPEPVASTCKSSKSVQIIGASSWQRCGRTRPQDERVAVVTFVSLRSGAVWHRLWGIALSHLSR